MRHFALIGNTLKHSFSKEYFDAQGFAGADYRLCEMPSVDGLRGWVAHEHIDGFNVTIPFKQTVIPHLDDLSPEAAAIGAVNCVVVDNGRLIGHNTDASAFRQTLEPLLPASRSLQPSAFILGTGGAAYAIAFVFNQLGIPSLFVSRHPEHQPNAIGYDELSISNTPFSILVNATPVGTWPDIDASPLPSDFQLSTSNIQLVYDLVYNPSPTLLMRQTSALGITTCGGLAMLHLQAQLSWRLWHLI